MKKKKKKFRVEVTIDPDELHRTLKVSCKDKVSRDEFLIELIDYIERQTDVTEDMLFDYVDLDGNVLH